MTDQSTKTSGNRRPTSVSRRSAIRIAGLGLLALVLSACQAARPASPASESRRITREPPGAALFVEALSGGDEVIAEEVASPLYRAEWERQGLPLPARLDLHADWASGPNGATGRIRFRYVGGLVGGRGFGHHLYLAQATDGADQARSSVWRVDTDPEGRVIWAELVWLFGDVGEVAASVGSGSAGNGSAPPELLRPLQPSAWMRIASETSSESYNAVLVRPTSGTANPSGKDSTVRFFGTDAEGEIRPGVWSYGQRVGETLAYGQRREVIPPQRDSGMDELRTDYLGALALVR